MCSEGRKIRQAYESVQWISIEKTTGNNQARKESHTQTREREAHVWNYQRLRFKLYTENFIRFCLKLGCEENLVDTQINLWPKVVHLHFLMLPWDKIGNRRHSTMAKIRIKNERADWNLIVPFCYANMTDWEGTESNRLNTSNFHIGRRISILKFWMVDIYWREKPSKTDAVIDDRFANNVQFQPTLNAQATKFPATKLYHTEDGRMNKSSVWQTL